MMTALKAVAQISTTNALLAGVYDGAVRVQELKQLGDFGLGTFSALDGELVMLDGQCYRCDSDGYVSPASPEKTSPFATVCHIDRQDSFNVYGPMDFVQLEELLNQKYQGENQLLAVHFHGQISSLHLRSLPAQSKPYPSLKQVSEWQPEFRLSAKEGDLVGFRCPEFMSGLNVTGLHLHFIDAARERGGHALNFQLAAGSISVEVYYRFSLLMPQPGLPLSGVNLASDRSEELEEIERKVSK